MDAKGEKECHCASHGTQKWKIQTVLIFMKQTTNSYFWNIDCKDVSFSISKRLLLAKWSLYSDSILILKNGQEKIVIWVKERPTGTWT